MFLFLFFYNPFQRFITVTRNDSVCDVVSDFELTSNSLDILQKNRIGQSFKWKSASESDDLLNMRKDMRFTSIEVDSRRIRMSYANAQAEMRSKLEYPRFQAKRALLPAFVHRNVVCSLVKQNQIVLISGETGCGKSTQVPQYLLDDPDIGT